MRVLRPIDPSVAASLANPEAWLTGAIRQTGAALAARGLSVQLPSPQTSLLLELTLLS